MPATVSSVAGSEPRGRPAPDASPSARWSRARPLALALVVGAMAAVMFASHRAGHWWGDDWALYVRQAQALLDGAPGRVAAENQFAVERSLGPAFSPPLYPWGFPLLLAPFVAVLGPDLDRLTVVPVLCACVFACAWFALARRRIGAVPALVGTVAVTLTPLFLGWTELIQSEWPFLATTAVVLAGLDRVAASDGLIEARGRVLPLVALGLGAAAAFSVRREGLAVVAAIAVAQLAALVDDPARRLRRPEGRLALLARLVVPHAIALATVALVQVVTPSTIVPRYSGTGIHNVWELADLHLRHLGEVSGLRRPGHDATVLGNVALGRAAVAVYVLAALTGAALALVRRRRRDLHLVAYALVAFLIGGSFRVAINRYVCTVGPIMLLLGLVAVTALVRRAVGPRSAVVAATVLVTAIAAANVVNAWHRVDDAARVADAGLVEWGPTHPDAIEMFDVVRLLTRPGDVVAGPKARAMTFATGRRAVQVDSARPVPPDLDLALIVTERSSDLTWQLRSETDRYTTIWQNERFLLFTPR